MNQLFSNFGNYCCSTFHLDLKIGVILAIFQSFGNIPVKIDWLNINVKDGETTDAEIFKIREEIPSTPDAFLGPLNHEVVSIHHFQKFLGSLRAH